MKVVGWVLYWLAYQALSLPLVIIGFPVVGLLAAFKAWYVRDSKNPMFPGKVTAWKLEPITLVWGNDEDGVDNGTGSRWKAFLWSACRNPTNNMRLFPGASCYSINPRFRDYSWGYVAVDDDGRWCVNVHGLKFGWLINRDAKKGWRSWPVLL